MYPPNLKLTPSVIKVSNYTVAGLGLSRRTVRSGNRTVITGGRALFRPDIYTSVMSRTGECEVYVMLHYSLHTILDALYEHLIRHILPATVYHSVISAITSTGQQLEFKLQH
jgi:hypothetical protein